MPETPEENVRSNHAALIGVVALALLSGVTATVLWNPLTAEPTGKEQRAKQNANERPRVYAAFRIQHQARDSFVPHEVRESPEDFERYQRSQVHLIKDRFVLNAALKDEEIAELELLRSHEDPVSWLQDNLEVTLEDELMFVSLRDRDTAEAAQLINAVTKAYMDEVVLSERNQRLERLNALERIYAEMESQIRNKRGSLDRLTQTIDTPASEQKLQRVYHAELQQRYARAMLALLQEQARLAVMEQTEPPASDDNAEAESAGDLQRLRQEIEVLKKEGELLRAEFQSLDQIVPPADRVSNDQQMLQNEIDQKERFLAQIGEKIDRTKVELQSPSRISRVTDAHVPKSESSP